MPRRNALKLAERSREWNAPTLLAYRFLLRAMHTVAFLMLAVPALRTTASHMTALTYNGRQHLAALTTLLFRR